MDHGSNPYLNRNQFQPHSYTHEFMLDCHDAKECKIYHLSRYKNMETVAQTNLIQFLRSTGNDKIQTTLENSKFKQNSNHPSKRL